MSEHTHYFKPAGGSILLCSCGAYEQPTQPVKEEWCSHMMPGKVIPIDDVKFIQARPMSQWNFCPICGTPRPKKQTIRDILDKYTTARNGFGDAFSLCKLELEQHFKENQ